MISLKALTACRSKSSGCLAMRSAVFIKFLPAKAAQCRLYDTASDGCQGGDREGVVPGRRIIGTAQGQVCIEEGGCTTVFCDLHMQAVNGGTKSERRRALRKEAYAATWAAIKASAAR